MSDTALSIEYRAFVKQLSTDLRRAFQEMKGFSSRNLLFMRRFAQTWPDEEIVKQLVSQLPWGRGVRLVRRGAAICGSNEDAPRKVRRAGDAFTGGVDDEYCTHRPAGCQAPGRAGRAAGPVREVMEAGPWGA